MGCSVDKVQSEFEKFDASMHRIISVSHEELKRRESEWKKQRKRKKRPKSASHAARA